MSEPVTMQAINYWYPYVFKKFGWMILASKYGKTEKIIDYLKTIEDLKINIETKINSLIDEDKKNDLKILLGEVSTLSKVANKVLPIKDPSLLKGGSRKSNKKN